MDNGMDTSMIHDMISDINKKDKEKWKKHIKKKRIRIKVTNTIKRITIILLKYIIPALLVIAGILVPILVLKNWMVVNNFISMEKLFVCILIQIALEAVVLVLNFNWIKIMLKHGL